MCIRCIYVGGLIARELTVSTGSYLARQFLLLQPAAIQPAQVGAEVSYTDPAWGIRTSALHAFRYPLANVTACNIENASFSPFAL